MISVRLRENSLAWWAVTWGTAVVPFVVACVTVSVVQVRSIGLRLTSAPGGNSAGKVLDNWTGAVMFIAIFCAVLFIAKRTRSIRAGIVAGLVCTFIYTIANVFVLLAVFRAVPGLAAVVPTSPVVLAAFVALRTAILPTAVAALAGEKWGDASHGRAAHEINEVSIGGALRDDAFTYAAATGVPPAPVEEPLSDGPTPDFGVTAFGAPVAPAAQSASAVAYATPVPAPATSRTMPEMASAAAAQQPRVANRCPKCGASNAPTNARCIVCGKPIRSRA